MFTSLDKVDPDHRDNLDSAADGRVVRCVWKIEALQFTVDVDEPRGRFYLPDVNPSELSSLTHKEFTSRNEDFLTKYFSIRKQR